MKKIIGYIIAAATSLLTLSSCEKIEEMPLNDANSISAISCFVYYDATDTKKSEEIKLLSYINQASGIGNYTFPAEPKYTQQTLSNCRLEVIIPATAKIVETDYDGNETNNTIGGKRTLYKTTVSFKIIAANGQEKQYHISFKMP